MSTTLSKVSENDLARFTGTDGFHKFSMLFRRHFLTDGAEFLAGRCGAFWLMEAIASHTSNAVKKDRRLADMQIWFLRKNKTNEGVNLTCWADTGSGERPKITQQIPYSDFFKKYDGEEIKFYCCRNEDNNWVIMLPSEY